MSNGETIEEQRKVEGFGDPQYTCSELELAIRVVVYTYFQAQRAAGNVTTLTMTQDWSGNTLHVEGSFRPRDLAAEIAKATVAFRCACQIAGVIDDACAAAGQCRERPKVSDEH